MPVSPHLLRCPVRADVDDQVGQVGGDEEEVDPRMALAGEPIIGMDSVVYDDATGSGALPADHCPSRKL